MALQYKHLVKKVKNIMNFFASGKLRLSGIFGHSIFFMLKVLICFFIWQKMITFAVGRHASKMRQKNTYKKKMNTHDRCSFLIFGKSLSIYLQECYLHTLQLFHILCLTFYYPHKPFQSVLYPYHRNNLLSIYCLNGSK